MQIKLNCDNRVILQGRVKRFIDGKFMLKSELVSVPCRVDCWVPEGLKDGDFVTVTAKLRYSNDNDTHKLILEKVKLAKETDTPVNHIALEGYPIEPITSSDGLITWVMRHNALTSKGEVYGCLIEVCGYGAVAKRLNAFIKAEHLYMVVGSLISHGKKLAINVEYAKDSKEITRDA